MLPVTSSGTPSPPRPPQADTPAPDSPPATESDVVDITLHPRDFSDVSSYEPGADWDAYAATGRPMAVCRASKGVNLIDDTAPGYRQALSQRGLYCGLYHFAGWPTTQVIKSPEEEAAFFLKAVGPLGPREFPILDFEQDYKLTPQQEVDWITRFCTIVEQKTGKTPWLYSGYNLASHLHGEQLARYPLWVAHYSATQLPAPEQWPHPVAWQYTEKGTVPGIGAKAIDDSHFYGDLSTIGQPATAK